MHCKQVKWAKKSIVHGPLPQLLCLPKASKMEIQLGKTLPKVALEHILRHILFSLLMTLKRFLYMLSSLSHLMFLAGIRVCLTGGICSYCKILPIQ